MLGVLVLRNRHIVYRNASIFQKRKQNGACYILFKIAYVQSHLFLSECNETGGRRQPYAIGQRNPRQVC
eukprot:XP_001706821.1 Hypothetical protein GL50803_39542 [Giardia lamblia ATCC 50803]